MTTRDQAVLSLRPQIETTSSTEMTDVERFQNDTLRPILKMQHDILIRITTHELRHRKKQIDTSSDKAYAAALEQWLKQDQRTRMSLIYCVVGMMTSDEVQYYHDNVSMTNRRITSMLIKRVVGAIVGEN